MVWRQLPKLVPAGSIPVSRSIFIKSGVTYNLTPLFMVSDFGFGFQLRFWISASVYDVNFAF